MDGVIVRSFVESMKERVSNLPKKPTEYAGPGRLNTIVKPTDAPCIVFAISSQARLQEPVMKNGSMHTISSDSR